MWLASATANISPLPGCSPADSHGVTDFPHEMLPTTYLQRVAAEAAPSLSCYALLQLRLSMEKVCSHGTRHGWYPFS